MRKAISGDGMAGTKEIKNHIESVRDTQKITNAMYLIASTKMQKAKAELDKTRPYFDAIQYEIKRIFRTVDNVESRWFYPSTGLHNIPGNYGYIVITADKGLAGAYNQNVIKQTLEMMERHKENKLFVIGEYGRRFFSTHNIPIEKSFLYTAQNPTMQRAREIGSIVVDMFKKGELVKVFVIYTDFSSGLDNEAKVVRVLPFHPASFEIPENEEEVDSDFEFEPSFEKVVDNIVPGYVTGFIYSALVSSFCSEQSSRMTAMDSANTNAQKLLDELSMQFNHLRQSAITQEITEISSGARGQKKD